jgi:hypothetical protein
MGTTGRAGRARSAHASRKSSGSDQHELTDPASAEETAKAEDDGCKCPSEKRYKISEDRADQAGTPLSEETGQADQAVATLSLRQRIELRQPLTYSEAAEFSHRSVGALRNEVYHGRLRPVGRTGRRRLFSIEDLMRLMGLPAPAEGSCSCGVRLGGRSRP